MLFIVFFLTLLSLSALDEQGSSTTVVEIALHSNFNYVLYDGKVTQGEFDSVDDCRFEKFKSDLLSLNTNRSRQGVMLLKDKINEQTKLAVMCALLSYLPNYLMHTPCSQNIIVKFTSKKI